MTKTVYILPYLDYYWGINLGKPEGTIELIRDFGDETIYDGINEGVKNWIAKNQRPLVV